MSRPRLFLSAVSTELRTARQAVAGTVRTLGFDPASQDDFPTGYGELRQWLREQIDSCEGLIQLVGHAYGAEPPDVYPEYGRVLLDPVQVPLRPQGKKTWGIVVGDHCHHDKPREQARQQVREAFPFADAPHYLLMDRDSIFSAEVARTLTAMQICPMRTIFGSPWQNGVAERWVGTCRRELLDHVIVLNEGHLRRLLREFLDYYHHDRTHLSLGKDPPCGRPVRAAPAQTAAVTALPRIGGLHHRYEWREAA